MEIPDFDNLFQIAKDYCAELISESERVPSVPDQIDVELADLGNARVVLWDIYGTLFATRAGDLESSLKTPEAMLAAFLKTAGKFGFWRGVPDTEDISLWFRERYLGQIESVHQKKKGEGIPYPEVRIEEIWEQIIAILEENGFRAGEEQRRLLPFRTALYFEIAFQQVTFYRGAVETLLKLKKSGLRQGIVSNAQFYTPLLLEYFLREFSNKGRISSFKDIFDEDLVSFSYQLGRSKPDPLIFDPVLKELDSEGIDRDEIIYVGNDMLNDVYLASSLGIKTVLFAADRNSLKKCRGDERVEKACPDAVITDYTQLPFMLSGGASTESRDLHIGIWHYHLRPGGVTSVIRDSLEALVRYGGYKRIQAMLLADTTETGSQLQWVEEFSSMENLSVEVRHVPQLAYNDTPAADEKEFLSRAWEQFQILIGHIDLHDCNKQNPYILYTHNAALGKNPYASAALRLFSEWALAGDRPLVILAQTHDFAELHRPNQVRTWRRACPVQDEEERAHWEFPLAANIVHVALTVKDRERLTGTGILDNSVYVLPNSVRLVKPYARKASTRLGEKLGNDRPYFLAAQKVMCRKNTLEALLVLMAIRATGFDIALVVTLPAASKNDKNYEKLVLGAVEKSGLPALIGIKRNFGERAPDFDEVVSGSAAFITTSVMEGFGQSFLEGWVAGRPVLGRRLDGPCRDFETAGVNLAHLYQHLLVDIDWLEGGLERVKDAYRVKLSKLRSELGFPPLDESSFEKEFALQKTFEADHGRTLVDFGDLSPVMQSEVIHAACSRKDEILSRVIELNPWLREWEDFATGRKQHLVEKNHSAVASSFGPEIKARRLRSIILSAAARIQEKTLDNDSFDKPRSLKKLLSETVSVKSTRLLYF